MFRTGTNWEEKERINGRRQSTPNKKTMNKTPSPHRRNLFDALVAPTTQRPYIPRLAPSGNEDNRAHGNVNQTPHHPNRNRTRRAPSQHESQNRVNHPQRNTHTSQPDMSDSKRRPTRLGQFGRRRESRARRLAFVAQMV